MYMKRKGSSIAAEIVADWRREEYYKKRIKQNKCIEKCYYKWNH